MKQFVPLVFIAALFLLFPAISEAQKTMQTVISTPEFTAKAISGEEVTLSKLKGKLVLVTFWATWCPFCAKQLPRIEKELWQAYKKSDDFAVLAVSIDETEAKTGKHAKEKKFTFPIISDPKKEIYDKFQLGGLPMTYLLNGEGTIIYARSGYSLKGFDKMKTVIETELKALRETNKRASGKLTGN